MTKYNKLSIQDVLLIEPKIFKDERGFFFEAFNKGEFENVIKKNISFVQDNHSKSSYGVLRGLHYQLPPFSQGKLVRVIRGKIFDVAVDIRKSSPTFGRWVAEILSETNMRQLWIPEGFAHGFQSLTNNTEVLYKVTNYYSSQHEKSILWNDPFLNIKWPLKDDLIYSQKDCEAKKITELFVDYFEK